MKTQFFQFVLCLAMVLAVIPPPTAVAAPHSQGGTIKYRVRRGDTLSSIARRYGTSVSAIKRANNLRSSLIYVNQTLKIPRSGSSSSASSSSSTSKSKVTCGTWYKVRRGNTLSSVSRLCGVSVARIKALNKLKSNVIRVGQWLRVKGAVPKPIRTPPTPEPPVPVDPPYPTPVYGK